MLSVLSILSFAAAGSALTLPSSFTKRDAISVTPHDAFSSSIGVLGCKIDTNRVAYWPSFPGCDDICVRVTANDRNVTLLKIDQSGGAFDISYDAWNYLMVGESATTNPQQGGGLAATYETVDPSECAPLLKDTDGKLAFAAANSMNFVTSCSADTWVGQNFALYNIYNSICTYGYDEVCTMPTPDQGNQPQCPNTLGSTVPLTTDPVYNIQYGTGEQVLAQ
jgi:hypothetical protein